jgi:hypothetical protein
MRRRDAAGRSALLILVTSGRFEHTSPLVALLIQHGADALDCGRQPARDSLLHLLCHPQVSAWLGCKRSMLHHAC